MMAERLLPHDVREKIDSVHPRIRLLQSSSHFSNVSISVTAVRNERAAIWKFV